jgi:hypothetical protein
MPPYRGLRRRTDNLGERGEYDRDKDDRPDAERIATSLQRSQTCRDRWSRRPPVCGGERRPRIPEVQAKTPDYITRREASPRQDYFWMSPTYH